jgi:hypothetical protein
MQAQVAINGTIFTLEIANWSELWKWIAKTVTAFTAAGETVKAVGIVIKGH